MNKRIKKFFISLVLLWLLLTQPLFSQTLWEVTTASELEQAVSQLKDTCPDGGTIVLAPGTYSLSNTIEFNGTMRVSLIGNGWNTIIKRTGNGDALRFINSSYALVRNLKIEGDLDASSGSGIVFQQQGSSSCTVDFCRIYNFVTSGIRFEGTEEYPLSGNSVVDCHFISNLGHQLYSYYNNDFYITGNQFGWWDTNHPLSGTFLDNSSAGTYTYNYHWNNVVAFRMKGAHYNRIENNRFEMSLEEGIIIGSPEDDNSNTFNIFVGNTIHTNSMSSSEVYSAVIAYNAVNTTFCGNQIFSWNTSQYRTKRCLEVNNGCSSWIITDNIFRHNTLSPALIYSTNVGHLIEDNIVD